MDAAVALQRKKTIKFLCIVDFPLSKQGIFFITLTQVKSPDTSLKTRCIGAFFLPAFITKDSQRRDASASSATASRVPVSAHGSVRGRLLFKRASYSISFFSGASDGASFGRVLLLATGMNRLANLFSPRLHT